MSVSDNSHDGKMTQTERFKQAAHDIGTDDNETHWHTQPRKIAKVKSQPEKPE